jgi:hypothetical protein
LNTLPKMCPFLLLDYFAANFWTKLFAPLLWAREQKEFFSYLVFDK